MTAVAVTTFDEWRAAARGLLSAGVPPADVRFTTDPAGELFGVEPPPPSGARHRVPPAFVALAETVACHRDPTRWGALYRALWRLTHDEPHLFDLATDADVRWLTRAGKAVRRDVHKMHAFVRFRAVGEHFVAWHRPDHLVVRRAAPFFRRRFPEMRWAILTPDESATWDGRDLHFGPGVSASEAPPPDVLEELWKTYYRATFNPARVNLRLMRKELPVRHWPTLPETVAIPAMLAESADRVAAMVRHTEGFTTTAAAFLPAARDLGSLRTAAAGCEACGLCRPATQTVFGEGPADARLMLVGEQPGDQEDVAGRPFVGPAGEVLNDALAAAGIDRRGVYVTNAVKHFKFDRLGLLRQHRRADVREVEACKPWLAAELEAVQPSVVVCLGATAAASVLGRLFRFSERRGEVVQTVGGVTAIATYHPSAVLRGHARAVAIRADLTAHLARARELVRPVSNRPG